jgi:hypothetical protein
VITLLGEGCSNNRRRHFEWRLDQLRRRHGAITDLRILATVD